MLCRGVGRKPEQRMISERVFQETYASGANLITGWRHWHARNIPMLGCSAKECDGASRTWPSELARLESLRIPDVIDGTWWWNSDAGYGAFGIKETFMSKLFLLPYTIPYDRIVSYNYD